MNIKVRFVVDADHANYGKIEFSTDTDFGSGTTHKYAVTSPAGIVIKALPVSPDDTASDGSVLIDIPLAYDGSFLYGDYTFRVVVNEDGLGLNVVDETKTFCFSMSSVATDLSVEVIVDCYAKKMVINDNTSYPTPSTVTREIRSQYPMVPYEVDEDDATTTSAQLIVDLTRASGVAYENVTFDVVVTANVDLQQELDEINSGEDSWDLGVIYAYTAYSQEEKIICNFDPCKIISCVDTKYRALLNTACKRGGVAQLSPQDASVFSLLGSYLAMYNYWRLCKDYEKTNYYYALIKALVKDCDCVEPSGAQPIPDSGIVYLAGDSAYQLWLNEGNSGTIDDFFASLNPVGEWIEISEDYFNPNYEHADIPFSYRLLRTHIEFKGGFKAIIGYTPSNANPLEILSSDFDPAEIDEQTFVAVFSDNICGARFFRDSVDGAWKVKWEPEVFNDTLDNTMSGMLALKNIAAAANIISGDWTVFPTIAYDNGYDGSGSVQLQWRTDGKFLYIRGAFSGPAYSSSGLVLLKAAYFDSIGISLENGYNFVLLDVDSSGTKGAPGYCKVLNGSIYVHTRSAGDDFTIAHNHSINGIIPISIT